MDAPTLATVTETELATLHILDVGPLPLTGLARRLHIIADLVATRTERLAKTDFILVGDGYVIAAAGREFVERYDAEVARLDALLRTDPA